MLRMSPGKKLIVSLGWPVGEHHLKRIQEVWEAIEVQDMVGPLRAEYRLSREGNHEELARVSAQLDAALARTNILFTRDLPRDLLKRSPNLVWVQLMSAGIDRTLSEDLLNSDVIFTDASGVSSRAIAEYVLCLMLMVVKQIPRILEQQTRREWHRRTLILSELRGRTLGIVGLGNIGREVARLAKAFDMRVLATRKSASQRQRSVGDADILYPPSELRELLRESDFVVLALPLTPETRNIIGWEELEAMKGNAYLINIGRGGLIREEALLKALEDRRIAGAALDVFQTEPLPPESPFWESPNVLVSPHVAGNIDTYVNLAIELFCLNLENFVHGEPLINLVEKETGY